LIVPLTGSVGNRISQLHHEQAAGTASQPRSHKQMIAIAFASKRRGTHKRKRK
jgi:hypothetical protein